MNESEVLVTCPYNRAHSIIKSRMQFHLTKCRLQSTCTEKVTCPYNSTHIVNRVELEVHIEICPNRIVLDSFMYAVGDVAKPEGVVPVDNSIDVPELDENWDDNQIAESVLDVVKHNIRERVVLINLIGAPKAERRAHRVQERIRYQRVIDSHPESGKTKRVSAINSKKETNSSKAVSASRIDEDNIKDFTNNNVGEEPIIKNNNGHINDVKEEIEAENTIKAKEKAVEQINLSVGKKPTNSIVKKAWNLPAEPKEIESGMKKLNISEHFPELGSKNPSSRKRSPVAAANNCANTNGYNSLSNSPGAQTNAWTKPIKIDNAWTRSSSNASSNGKGQDRNGMSVLPITGRGRGYPRT